MSNNLTSIEVIRAGTALRVGRADGSARTVRRIDLARVLGAPKTDAPRFAAAEIDGDRVRLRYADGHSELLAAAYLDEPPEDRRADLVVEDAGLLLTANGPGTGEEGLGLLQHGAVIASGGRVRWVGPSAEVGRAGFDISGAERVRAGGRLVTPGLVDCHVHPLFAGNRASEFGARAAGRSYQEIAQAGGGIQATVQPTRAASFDTHIIQTVARMNRILAAGTTTCEAKSGYDLTVAGELRLLAIALAADALSPLDLSPTLLGAHALPPEYADDRAGYVRAVAEQMVPQVARERLAETVDVYCDDNAFTLAETRQILEAAKREGLALRVHAGQFADLGAAELIAELGGLSADHLEQVSPAGISAMAERGVVAVMLPGACVQLGLPQPPVSALREAGVAMAVATDNNPGTSLCDSLPVQMWLATTHYRMSVPEAWLGVTRHAARALGRKDIGVLAPGARADLLLWNAETPAEIPYHYGANLVDRVIKNGRTVHVRPSTQAAHWAGMA
ncbi:imidazolonepropionase [Haliangium ochraceum]|uniref:Imidazolonepropionase n=1 Tax=Haliangium ochraceum (strain DSM 14365 / JCM 11303 / SMP-2) TaxID=502025 RepID=D0LZE1_HALO1|nr:imidazolonepropionase [Haliangium ochraceum]ACY16403.1 imidazolonepropionase [Haliangium ochraceum DSM 14365]